MSGVVSKKLVRAVSIGLRWENIGFVYINGSTLSEINGTPPIYLTW